MERDEIENILKAAHVSATPNRVLVLRAITAASGPMSLAEIETDLETLDKSSISRVLNLLESHHIIHSVQDGRGVDKYEICHSSHDCHTDSDMHIHFYCTSCRRTFCFEEMAVPKVEIPEGFNIQSVNYMLKGLCPDCRRLNE